jgi:hypothetical protein
MVNAPAQAREARITELRRFTASVVEPGHDGDANCGERRPDDQLDPVDASCRCNPKAAAIAVPIRAATIPTRSVSHSGIFCRPARLSGPDADNQPDYQGGDDPSYLHGGPPSIQVHFDHASTRNAFKYPVHRAAAACTVRAQSSS